MTQNKNPFGGGNPNSLYVPMTEIEQEALHRLKDSGDFQVRILGWGHLDSPEVIVGDARVSFLLDLQFSAPVVPVAVTYFDLELRTGAGQLLRKERLPVAAGAELMIGAGIHLVFAWDIMVHHLSPQMVKMLMPGAIGLTSRRLDRDTGEATLTGNMQTTPVQRKLLQILKRGEDIVRADDKAILLDAAKRAGEKVKRTDKGLLVQDVK